LALLAAAQGVLVRSAHAIDPPVKPPASSDREAWPDDPEFTRVIFMPTAFLRPVGERTWTMTGVTLHQLHFGVGESIQLGVGALIPVGILAGSIHAKVGGSVSELFHLAGSIDAFGGTVFVDDDSGTVLAVGLSGIATIGTPEIALNLGVSGYLGDDIEDDGEAARVLLPNAGLSARVGRKLRAVVELIAVVTDDGIGFGEVWWVSYALRLFGDDLFGDVGFVVPLFDEAEEALALLPMGFPFFTFGARF